MLTLVDALGEMLVRLARQNVVYVYPKLREASQVSVSVLANLYPVAAKCPSREWYLGEAEVLVRAKSALGSLCPFTSISRAEQPLNDSAEDGDIH